MPTFPLSKDSCGPLPSTSTPASRQRTLLIRLFLFRWTVGGWIGDSLIRQWICMNCNARDHWRILRGGFVFQWETFPLVQSIEAIKHLAKHGVHIIEMRLGFVQNEEL